jgi:hypothetical protein
MTVDTPDDGNVADITLERYRLDELPSVEREPLARRLLGDQTLRERLQALDQSDRQIRANGGLETIARDVRARAEQPKRTLRRTWPALAAAAVVLFVMVAARMAAPTSPFTDRIKGLQPALSVFRKAAAGSETLADGAVVRNGDLLRVGYRAAGRAYGVILSIDGRRSVTLHLPARGDQSARLERDGIVLLDQAYELDDAPRWERFYLVTGEKPFAVTPIVEAARRAAAAASDNPPAALPLPAGLDQSTFSLQKEARP